MDNRDSDRNRGAVFNPYAAPKSKVSEQDGEIVLAGRWRRLFARLIDTVIVSIMVVIAAFIIFGTSWIDTYLTESLSTGNEAWTTLDLVWGGLGFMTLVLVGLQVGIYLAFNVYLLATRGQTVGKWMLGIRIVDYYTGSVPNLRFSLVLREGVLLLLGFLGLFGQLASIVDVLFIFSENRRCLHDYWSFTKVIET